MVSFKSFQQQALKLPGVTEEPHFEKTSFRVNKKIFATWDAVNKRASIKLSLKDQDIFSSYDKAVICPVPNKWGQQGWTLVDLSKVPAKIFAAALTAAYCSVAPPKLSAQVTVK
jgi:predicted DNA-binding protein (MmcQ/YjbR family)